MLTQFGVDKTAKYILVNLLPIHFKQEAIFHLNHIPNPNLAKA